MRNSRGLWGTHRLSYGRKSSHGQHRNKWVCVPIKLHLWTLRVDCHIIFRCHEILFFCFLNPYLKICLLRLMRERELQPAEPPGQDAMLFSFDSPPPHNQAIYKNIEIGTIPGSSSKLQDLAIRLYTLPALARYTRSGYCCVISLPAQHGITASASPLWSRPAWAFTSA